MIGKLFKLKQKKEIETEKVHDKIIRIGSIDLVAPFEHKLGEYLQKYPEYSINFGRICKILKQLNILESVIIDIGGNIGDTTSILRKFDIHNHILIIEGAKYYNSYLKKNASKLGDVEILNTFLTDNVIEKAYEVEVENGTAHLANKEGTSDLSLMTLDELLKDSLKKISLIKIDTDGFDFKILKGAKQTILNYHPILFFEYDQILNENQKENIFEVFSFLLGVGYYNIIFYDNYGRFLINTNLENNMQLKVLHRYICNGKGAFPYYDVLVFPRSASAVLEKFIEMEIGN